PGAPGFEHEATTNLRPMNKREKARAARPLAIPKPIAKAVAAMQTEGLMAEMTPALLAESVDGAEPPDMFELIYTYYLEPRRGKEDRYLTHDWRFGQETDDVVAELSELVGDGTTPPLFVQVENTREAFRVRGPRGVVETIDLKELDDVVQVFNRELAMR